MKGKGSQKKSEPNSEISVAGTNLRLGLGLSRLLPFVVEYLSLPPSHLDHLVVVVVFHSVDGAKQLKLDPNVGLSIVHTVICLLTRRWSRFLRRLGPQ